MAEQFEAYGRDESIGDHRAVMIFAEAQAPAAAVASIANTVPDVNYTLATIGNKGGLRGQTVASGIREGTPSWAVSARQGRYSLREIAVPPTDPTLDGPLDDLSALGEWAETVPNDLVVAIEASDLSVQQFLDVRVALQGPECDLLLTMRGEEPPEGCHIIATPLRP